MLAWLRSRAWARGGLVDAGATLAEVMVVVALIGGLSAMVVWGVRGWMTASAFKGASQQVESVLRSTQQQAITEGKSFCVDFDVAGGTYGVYRFACTDPGRVKVKGPFGTGSGAVHLSGPLFRDAGDVGRTGVTFLPRGSAWPGQVSVVRDGSSLVAVVRVEGMTGRVWAG
ncbi:pilus assembly FimT family protein [Tessaracoccus sp.]